MPLVHAVDARSNNSGTGLVSPTPSELERLTQLSRAVRPSVVPETGHEPSIWSLRRRLAPRVIKELVARYNAGATIRALSLEFKVSRSGLRHLLQDEGVELRVLGISPEAAEEAVRLYESGLTIRQIAEQLGSSFGTIQRMLHENGVVMRPSRNGK